jgi:hypothetical protein
MKAAGLCVTLFLFVASGLAQQSSEEDQVRKAVDENYSAVVNKDATEPSIC